MRRRVLIVTYDFPPVGGSGVQRVVKFAKYLPRFGWNPVVLTTGHGRPVPRDHSLMADVQGVEVHRTPAPHPYRLPVHLRRLLGRVHDPNSFHADMAGSGRGPWHPTAWLLPDGKLIWLPSALSWALQVDPSDRCDVVLSSIPTPTAAIVGSMVSDLWRVPHVLDYRDPWSGAFYLPRRIAPLERLERAWERRILDGARAAVYVPGVRELLPPTTTHLVTLHNGYDEEDFQGIDPKRPGEGFVVAHVGIMWRDRGVVPLIKALAILRNRDPALTARLHFLQVGRIDAQIAKELERLGQEITVTALPSVPHGEAIAYMLGADLLFLPTSHDCMPGKTYEYLRSGTPILGLGGTPSHLASLLTETGGGRLLDRSDFAGIANYLGDIMTGSRAAPPTRPRLVSRYSREAGAQALARLLDGVVTGAL